jgi:hypothetical protein
MREFEYALKIFRCGYVQIVHTGCLDYKKLCIDAGCLLFDLRNYIYYI